MAERDWTRNCVYSGQTVVRIPVQTIQEQQKVIRRLLKKTSGETLKQPNYCEVSKPTTLLIQF